jgi:prepilin-type N-terminal cleavage/methylation domain-containing protein
MLNKLKLGVTLLELVVVVLILGILSTIAVPVFVGQVTRAKIAATADTIRQLEVAIARYQIDTGELPPSFTVGSQLGNGWLMEALLHSTGGNIHTPTSPRWKGPYIEFNANQLLVPGVNGVPDDPGIPDERETQLIDPFESPYNYIRYTDYESMNGTELPMTHPFYSTETYYNPRTVQIWSFGPDGMTDPAAGQRGTDNDDITNF